MKVNLKSKSVLRDVGMDKKWLTWSFRPYSTWAVSAIWKKCTISFFFYIMKHIARTEKLYMIKVVGSEIQKSSEWLTKFLFIHSP